MQNDSRRNYVVRGNKLQKPLPPISIKQEDDKDLVEFENLIRSHFDYNEIVKNELREVRIFLSSTFSDFKVERNMFIKKVLPELRQTCTANALDLRLCDMRWGVTDTAVNEHLVEKLCANEIDLCRQHSIGPFFVLLLGNRYGYQPIPSEIAAEEFEMLIKIIADNYPKEIDNFKKWYAKDENAQPHLYVLLPIRTFIPGYGDFTDEEIRRVSGHEWWQLEEAMRRTIKRATKIACDTGVITLQRQHELTRSVTETELLTAVRNQSNYAVRCLAYERQLVGLTDNLHHEAARNFIDYMLRDNKTVTRPDCLHALAEFRRTITTLNLAHFRQYKVPWMECGLSEDSSNTISEHREYLEKLTRSIVGDLRNLIKTSLRNNSTAERYKKLDRASVNLQSEVVLHWLFTKQRLKIFCGRSNQLEKVQELLSANYQHPIVLFGKSGCGKTTLMSSIAKQLQNLAYSRVNLSPLTPDNKFTGCFNHSSTPILIMRYIGTSPNTTSLQQVLFGVCLQLQLAYRLKVAYRKMWNVTSLIGLFHQLLLIISRRYSQQYPLVLMLDSLDQLIPALDSCIPVAAKLQQHQCDNLVAWLPASLPSGVFIITSIASDAKDNTTHGNLNEHLICHLTSKSSDAALNGLIEVGEMQPSEIEWILQTKLLSNNRQLTEKQMEIVMDRLLNNPQALYINIIIDKALKWTSFLLDADVKISQDTHGAIQDLFGDLEERYGTTLIRFTLGYLTLGLSGLSEVEIEDLLSLQDEVLNEVYQYHDPPIKGIIRIPALLWSRVHSDLATYLVEKQTDNKVTLSWYHKLIQICAFDRYLSDEKTRRQLHWEIAGYYLLTESTLKSITLTNSKRSVTLEQANRLICHGPMTSNQPRRLHAIVYHLIQLANADLIVKHCIGQASFIIAYMQCFGIYELMSFLKQAHDLFPDNSVINIIRNCIIFIESWISPKDKQQFAIQMLGHLNQLRIINDSSQFSDDDQTIYDTIQQFCDELKSYLHDGNFLVPSSACFPTCLGAMKLYKQNVESIKSLPWNSQLIILFEHTSANGWIVRIFDTINLASIIQIKMDQEPLIATIPSLISNLIFIQDNRHIFAYDCDTGQLESKHGLLINNKLMLNECMAVDKYAQWIAIAAQNRIAILEHKPSMQDKNTINYKFILTAREVDKTVSLCFLETESHSILLSVHTYHSKTNKMFIIKIWQFEQSNELWSLDLLNLSSKLSDRVVIYPLYDRESCSTCNNGYELQSNSIEEDTNEDSVDRGSVIIVLPNGVCFYVDDILDNKSLRQLQISESSDNNSNCNDRIQSVVSDDMQATISCHLHNRPIAQRTVIWFVQRQPIEIHKLSQVTQLLDTNFLPITTAFYRQSELVFLGGKSGAIALVSLNNPKSIMCSWQAHRGPIDLIIAPNLKAESTSIKMLTYCHSEKVIKCWMKDPSTLDNRSERFSRSIFEYAIAICSSSDNNEEIVVLDQDLTTVYRLYFDKIQFKVNKIKLNPAVEINETLESDNKPVITSMWLVMSRTGLLIVTSAQVLLYNLDTGELISSLNPQLDSPAFWCCYTPNTFPDLLLIVTFQVKSSYYRISAHNIPNLSNIRINKKFLPPVGVSRPHFQLINIDQMIFGGAQHFIILSFFINNNLPLRKSIENNPKMPNSNGFIPTEYSKYLLYCSLNLSDVLSTPNLVLCNNMEDSKKSIVKNAMSKSTSQQVFSYAIMSHNNSGPSILIGGMGEILIWDLVSGSCRLQKLPNFHTWLKHSVTININGQSTNSTSPTISNKTNRGNAAARRGSQTGSLLNAKSSPMGFQLNPITALLLTSKNNDQFDNPLPCLVLSGCSAGYIIHWNWTETLKLNGAEPDCPKKYRFIVNCNHSAEVSCLAINTNQSLLASGSTNMELYLTNLQTNTCLHQLRIHCVPYYLQFQPSSESTESSDDMDNSSTPSLICSATHIGQNRLLCFDLIQSSACPSN